MAGGIAVTMFQKHYLVFCDADKDGRIIEGIQGVNIIPDKDYEFFFYLGEGNKEIDLMEYKIAYEGRKAILIKKTR